MSQQINLLRGGGKLGKAVLQLAVALVVVAAAAIAYGWSATQETARLRESVAAGDSRLAQLRARIAPPVTPGGESVADIEAELAQLRTKAEAVKQLMANVHQGQVDSSQGLSQQLLLVTALPHDEVWISGVDVTNGGRVVALSGKALRSESVIRFARAASEQYKSLGVRFRTLEIISAAPAPAESPGRPATSIVAFKLY